VRQSQSVSGLQTVKPPEQSPVVVAGDSGTLTPGSEEPPERAGGGSEYHDCRECGYVGTSSSGLSLHMRSKHPMTYHASCARAACGATTHWTKEEEAILVNEDIALEDAGVRDINLRLRGRMAGRTLECHRKQPEYKSLKERVQAERANPILSDPERAVPGAESWPPQDSESVLPASVSNPSLVDSVRESVTQYHLDREALLSLCDLVDGTAEVHGSLEYIQDLADEEYADWLATPGLLLTGRDRGGARKHKRTPTWRRNHGGSGAPSAPNAESDRPARRGGRRRSQKPSAVLRRARYAEVQRLYRLNRKRCAEHVLSGDWSKEARTATEPELEAFWS
jgi:hypothetical protein